LASSSLRSADLNPPLDGGSLLCYFNQAVPL